MFRLVALTDELIIKLVSLFNYYFLFLDL
jgi:hypothetical protein